MTAHASGRTPLERIALFAVVVLSILAAIVTTTRVTLNPDVAALLPSRGDAAILARYLRAFGGGGVGVVLVEGEDAEQTRAAADEIAAALAARPAVAFVSAKLEVPAAPEPMLAWRTADAAARERLTRALTPEGMRERLAETRQLLSTPGSGVLAETIAADPLRLAEIASERDGAVGTGVQTRSDGYFATEDGRAHLVVVKPKGHALRGAEARAFVGAVEEVLEPVRSAHPNVTIGATGPHAVAAEMEGLLRSDLTRSGAFSAVFASAAFALVFRRLRAILAILPPLALGTLWTAALAPLWPGGLSAIAVAFTSVVVGVGFDTGVHVYSALLEARRSGLSPADAARAARARAAKPVLVAATIAAVAFASLALSSVEALAQLGILCAAGEVLTAVAIVAVTPEIGALLERSDPPPGRIPRFVGVVHALTATRSRAAAAVVVCLALGGSAIVTGVRVSDSIVAVRPKSLPSLDVERRVFEAFGGKVQPYIVLVADPARDEAMRRADVIAEALGGHRDVVERVDGLLPVLPAEATQRARLAGRDALDMPARAADLEKALEEMGFNVGRFERALAAMRAPSSAVASVEAALEGDLGVLASRYLAAEGGEHLAALHVHVREGAGLDALSAVVAGVDPGASITGYARLEADLRQALGQDLPQIALAGGVLVLVLLAASLRRAREVLIAAVVLATGIGALLGAASVLGVPLHVYSALVIPVLLGISVDEAMFLFYERRRAEGDSDPILRTLSIQGPAVVATALTTSAGFIALATARYEGLRDLGIVGALGNAATLIVALVLVPAGLRLVGSSAERG